MAFLPQVRKGLASLRYRKPAPAVDNAFARAFYGFTGLTFTAYDPKGLTYLEKGMLYNPTVYSVIKQKSDKAKSIPYFVKRITNAEAKAELDMLRYSTKGFTRDTQRVRELFLKERAYGKEYLDFPLKKPNPLQTWAEIIALYEVFMDLTGNFYLYVVAPNEGKGEPMQVYVLPSHLVEIILKRDANVMGLESPIDSYRLIIGNKFVDFPEHSVIHVKLPNPQFGLNGEHLYGLSPLRPILRNIQSSNEAIDNNNRTLLNSGSFGFIHGKNIPLSAEQAEEVKGRLQEMRSLNEALSHVQGASAELAFTRINPTTDELKPFDFLSFDEKQVCNALGWDDKLLNNEAGAKYDNVEWAERRVLVNTIAPSLKLLEEALNDRFITRFPGYDRAVFEFDYSELPEMQIDVADMVGWLTQALDRGVITRNEFRKAVKYPGLDDKNLDIHTVASDIIPLEEALGNDPLANDSEGY